MNWSFRKEYVLFDHIQKHTHSKNSKTKLNEANIQVFFNFQFQDYVGLSCSVGVMTKSKTTTPSSSQTKHDGDASVVNKLKVLIVPSTGISIIKSHANVDVIFISLNSLFIEKRQWKWEARRIESQIFFLSRFCVQYVAPCCCCCVE